MTLNVFSLFSGIGGLELGLERAGMTTVGQVEIDPYCRRVLAKHWPEVPRHDDVRTAVEWWRSEERPGIDVICGGFPCQDLSLAGRRTGITAGTRSSLWTAMADAVRRIRPRYVVMENVAAILVRDRFGCIPIEVVAADLAEIGYQLRWDCVTASAVGAPHRRDRWFGIADLDRDRRRDEPVGEQRSGRPPLASAHGTPGHVADPHRTRLQDFQGRSSIAECSRWRAPDRSDWWRVEPAVGRVVHGASQPAGPTYQTTASPCPRQRRSPAGVRAHRPADRRSCRGGGGVKRLLTWLEYRKQLRDIRRIRSSVWFGWDRIPVALQGETTFPCERIGAAPAVLESPPGPLRTPTSKA